MRTSKALYPRERIIYKPELSECPHCGEPFSESYARYLYQQVYLPLLACQEQQHQHRLAQAVQHHGGLILALDGLAPEGGEPQLWFIRELFTGLTLRSGWLSQFDHGAFETFLAPLSTALPGSVVAVLSDKQRGLLPAVATVFPQAHPHFCHAHYLKNLAEPWAEVDSAFKVDLRKAAREAVGPLIRAEAATAAPPSHVLCVTGMYPDELPVAAVSAVDATRADAVREAAVMTQLFRHTRYLLTLKGRPPFRLAGMETYQHLRRVVDFTDQLRAEQQRLRQHLARFRLHSRSDDQTCAQFDRLRQLWFSLGKTSTG